MKILKTTKSRLSIAIIMVMLLQVFMPMVGDIAWAEGGGKDLGNIFEFTFLKINGVDHENGAVVEIEQGTTTQLEYTWDTEDLNVKAGDYSEIIIPDTFDILNDIEPTDIVVNEITVGTYSVVGNLIRLEFSEGAEDFSELKNGTIGFGVSFDETIFNEDVVKEIDFRDDTEKTLTVIMPPIEDVKQINKSGLPDASKDAKKITWTIDVTNPSKEAIAGADIQDLIPEGLVLDASTIILERLTIGKDGSLNKTGDMVTPLTHSLVDNEFTVNLGEMGAYKGYRLTYTTDITDFTIKEFTNDASLNYGDESLQADATVTGLERSDLIEKSGEPINKGDQIEWTIDVNKAGSMINNAIVEDVLPEFTTLTLDSIKIFVLVKEDNKWKETELEHDFVAFPIELGDIGKGARRIKFKTDIDYTKVNGGEYQGSNDFENKATLKDGETPLDEDIAKVTTQRESIITKNASANINYETKEINWTISVNKANHKIDNAKISDLIPEGLKIKEDSVKVFEGTETGLNITTADTVYINITEATEDAPEKLEVKLGNITSEHTITFTTDIEDFEIAEFENTGSLEGDGVGEDGNTSTKPIEPTQNSFGKKFEDIDYINKTMSWSLEIKPTLKAISELKIIDTFPNKGLILLKDTVVVTLAGEELTLDTDYKLTPRTVEGVGGYHLGFEIEFRGDKFPLNDTITITYKTSFDPNKIEDKNISKDEDRLYTNNAQFIGKTTNGVEFDTDREAEKEIREEAWNTGQKKGKLISKDESGNLVDGWVSGNERRIEWTVYANYLKQNLTSPVAFEDTLDYEGEVDTENIKLLTYTVNKEGDIIPGEQSALVYEVIEKTKGFKLNFTGDVKERFAVVFTTSVPKISKKAYTNSATTTADDHDHSYSGTVDFTEGENHLSKEAMGVSGENVYTDQELNWKIAINESLSIVESDITVTDTISAGHIYKHGSLKVYRYDGTTRVDADSEEYRFTPPSTNEDGRTVLEVVFNTEIKKQYDIEYSTVVTSTEGTINNSVSYKGKNFEKTTKESKKYTAKQSHYASAEGDPLKGQLTVEKYDDNGDLITDFSAKFDLLYKVNPSDPNEEYKRLGNVSYETEDGEVNIVDIPLNRTYYLKEVEAPEGHLINEELILIEITKNKNKMIYVESVENVIIRGDIQLVKKDNERNLLEGVQFTLDAKNDSEFESVTAFSNADGLVEFQNIPYGQYTIKEVSSLEGYIMDEREIPVTIEENGKLIKLQDVVNTKIRGNVEFTKMDNEEEVLPGAKFGIYSKDDLEDPIETAFSDENGLVRFEGIAYGDYTIQEISAPEGYDMDVDAFDVNITEHNETINLGQKVNTKIRGCIEITKRSKDDGIPLAGAEFALFQDGVQKYDSVETDEKGRAKFEGVEFGEYTIREIRAPEGYNLDSEDLKVTISEHEECIEGSLFENTKIRGRIKLTKVDKYDNLLEGAEFALYDSDNALVEKALSNKTGEVIFKGVPYGEYTIRETKAPAGYKSDDTVYNVSITENGETIQKDTAGVDLKFVNTELGRIKIVKVDSDNKSKLAGAVFEIRDSTGKAVQKVTTDKNGIAMVLDLEYGSYTVVETKAPRGYLLDETVHTVEVNGEDLGKNIEATVEIENCKDWDDPIWIDDPDNPYGPTDPGLPKTGQGSNMLFYLAGLGLIGLGFVFRRKDRKA